MKKWTFLALTLAILLLLGACGKKEESSSSATSDDKTITIKHELGEAKVKENPDKVVVFDFGVLDTLDELGVKVDGVPQAAVPPYLEDYKNSDYTNVGSLKEPDFEAIHSLKPDVIFISARQADLYDEFAEIAPTVYIPVDSTDYVNSFKSNMNTIAKIFNKEDEMKKELAELDKEVKSIQEETESLDSNALVIMGSSEDISAFGPESRFGIIHDVFGFKPADDGIEKSTHGQKVTYEYVKEQNPGILFVIDRDAAFDPKASIKESFENDLVKKTQAFKDDRIIYLNGAEWYLSGGGLQSMRHMIEDAKKAL
ncbi:siderophore ABC transporter substrate-binding protein [Rossellomorea marisflavi]|uniref:siderophore ABC transporter substrate-binding protein n=1 Tax=Rossellomorea marisflavi TaxID=189381 RepID=UPI00203F6E4F|nr:siderophore ABC transporter substrate-binding protein [Rossellomorea marisflavi]MCM2587746.1 siderophore ABC transporter substrate-binding protein [Rossellomorea marisflavi]